LKSRFITPPNSVTARPWIGRAAVVLFALALAACATTPPPATIPQRASLPPPALLSPQASVPLQQLAKPDAPSLELARRVLEERAETLGPLAREGIAHILARAEGHDGVPVLMVVAIIEQESHFDPHAVGPRGARGLMQIRPFVARDVAHRAGWPFERQMLRDPVENVRLGVRYLTELRRRFGTSVLALAAYNAGPSRVERRVARGRSTTGPYVRQVLERYDQMRERYGAPELASGG
jgi:soluble lytic murein transglycosylase-like protein